MKEQIENFNNARKEIEFFFRGLPHSSALVINLLITLANPETGIVANVTWQSIAKLIEVIQKPGRKNAGIPSKEKVREIVATIIKQCPDDFKLITVGKNLQFCFPKLPRIYACFLQEKAKDHIEDYIPECGIKNININVLNVHEKDEIPIENYTDLHIGAKLNIKDLTKVLTENHTQKICEKNIEINRLDLNVRKEGHIIDPTDLSMSSDNNINNKINNNIINKFDYEKDLEQTYLSKADLKIIKTEYEVAMKLQENQVRSYISDKYFPRASTINKALAEGYANATDPALIQEFINYNKAIGSKWTDFDAVYLLFLSRKKQKPPIRSNDVDQNAQTAKSGGKTTQDRVREAYGEDIYAEITRMFYPEYRSK